MKKPLFLHFIISLLGLVLLRLWLDGKLALYIHPSTFWLVGVAAITLIAGSLYWVVKRPHHFHALPQQIALLGLITVFLVVGKSVAVSPSLAQQRSSDKAVPVGNRQGVKLTQQTKDFTVLDWAAAWESSPLHYKYVGRPVEVIGFITVEGSQYSVTRLMVTCCAVDAQPISLAISPLQPMPAAGSWVKVEGKMGNNNGKPQVETNKIIPVPEPENPYVY